MSVRIRLDREVSPPGNVRLYVHDPDTGVLMTELRLGLGAPEVEVQERAVFLIARDRVTEVGPGLPSPGGPR